MDNHHNNSSYPCSQCDFVSHNKMNLWLHTRKVHLGILFKCEHCDYSNSMKQAVKVHTISKHMNIKFKCPHCPYTTNWLSDLRRHNKGQGTCGGPCGPLPPNPEKSCM